MNEIKIHAKGSQPALVTNHLRVNGPAKALDAFSQSNWPQVIGARQAEALEYSPDQAIWQFVTEAEPPIGPLAELSRQWPTLGFTLAHVQGEASFPGLAPIKTGAVTRYRLRQ